MTLAYVCCSSECLYTGVEHICGQWHPLHCYASYSFSFRDAYNGHLACFPALASTVYSHALVWTWWSVEYHSHTLPCLGTVVSDTVHAAWYSCFYTASLPWQSIQEPCSRPPFQEDSDSDWTGLCSQLCPIPGQGLECEQHPNSQILLITSWGESWCTHFLLSVVWQYTGPNVFTLA